MNVRLYFILFYLPFLSFVPRQINHSSKDYKKYKNIADSIFHSSQTLDSFSFQRVYYDSILDQPKVAVMVGHLFTCIDRNAIVIYSTTDSTLDLNLFEIKNSKWNLAQRQSIKCWSTGPADKFVFFDNLNENKTNGLLILTNVWLIRTGENFKAFLFKKNKMAEVKGFENFPNPVYDSKTKKIYSYMGTGCADMTMEFLEGAIRKDSIVTLLAIGCDCCSDTENADSCSIYINNKKPFKVQYDNSYKYVQPFYQDFLKNKLKQIKEN